MQRRCVAMPTRSTSTSVRINGPTDCRDVEGQARTEEFRAPSYIAVAALTDAQCRSYSEFKSHLRRRLSQPDLAHECDTPLARAAQHPLPSDANGSIRRSRARRVRQRSMNGEGTVSLRHCMSV